MGEGLRERKKTATRLALHEAALRLVAERGLQDVSIDAIAERADVSARTFFNYFSSKEDAVVGLDPAAPQRLFDALASRPASRDTGRGPPRRCSASRPRRWPGRLELWPLRMQVIDAHPALRQRLIAGFAESERSVALAIADRTGTSTGIDVYPTLLASVQACVMRTALHRWLDSAFSASLPALVDEGWDVLEAGLAPPPR